MEIHIGYGGMYCLYATEVSVAIERKCPSFTDVLTYPQHWICLYRNKYFPSTGKSTPPPQRKTKRKLLIKVCKTHDINNEVKLYKAS